MEIVGGCVETRTSMFGVLISGRLVDTNFRSVDPTHVLIDIPSLNTLNHVVVFLTGSQAFPDGMGGAVYFNWPCSATSASWQLLGSLTNQKPSAIYKVTKLKQNNNNSFNDDMSARFGSMCSGNSSNNVVQDSGPTGQLGISVEPIMNIMGQTPVQNAEPSNLPAFVEFSQKMVENLFNYTSSYAVNPTDLVNQYHCNSAAAKPSETYVPFSSMKQWYTNFERRLQANPYFWKS